MKNISKICCISTGYVGRPTLTVIASQCPEISVTVVDINQERIDRWNDSDLNNLPVYEPELKELAQKTRGKNFFFSTDVDEAKMIFISLNTPYQNLWQRKGSKQRI